MTATSERNSIYKIIGTVIVIINVICAVINFLVVWRSNNLFWALLTLLIYAVSTFISAVPFFALHEVIDRIERLEKAAIMSDNEFYTPSQEVQSTTWISEKYEKEPEEDYKGFSFEGNIRKPAVKQKKTEPKCEKGIIDDKTWQCSCGKINPKHTGACGCGERRPEYQVIKSNRYSLRKLEDKKWQCSCGKINPKYVGTCGCGVKRPR